MLADYFLLFLGVIWSVFASIQDLKHREVANWLNFSLLGFALLFRLSESWMSGNWNYLFYGIVGMAVLFVIANMFYYIRAFAGGDAKLLWAIGAILPYNSWQSVWILLLGFLILFMIIGVLYTLVYTIILLRRNPAKFSKEFMKNFRKLRIWLFVSWIICLLLILFGFFMDDIVWYFGAILVFWLPLLYIYLKAIETACLVSLVDYRKLREGDWLENPIRIGGKWIGKSVH